MLAIKEEASPEVEQLAERCSLDFARPAFALDRNPQGRRHHRSDDGRAGEARQDLFVHPAGLEAGEAAGGAEAEEHGGVDRRRGAGFGGGRHSSGGFHAAAQAAAGGRGCAEQAQAVIGGGARHRLWPQDREHAGGHGCGPERRDLRRRLRGGGSDGRHRRDAGARGVAGERETAAAGESLAAAGTFAVRCSGGGSGHHRSDAESRCDGAGGRRRPDAAAGSRSNACAGRSNPRLRWWAASPKRSAGYSRLFPIRSESKYSFAAGWFRILAQFSKASCASATWACTAVDSQVFALS